MCIEVLGREAAALAAAEHPHVPAAAAAPAHRHVHPTLGGGLADLHTHSLPIKKLKKRFHFFNKKIIFYIV
jgi:hypothetical protein